MSKQSFPQRVLMWLEIWTAPKKSKNWTPGWQIFSMYKLDFGQQKFWKQVKTELKFTWIQTNWLKEIGNAIYFLGLTQF